MLPDLIFKVLLVVPVGAMATLFIYVGLQAIVKRRPILFSSQLFIWTFTVAIGAMAVAMISLQFSSSGSDFEFSSMILIAMFAVLLFVMWRQMQGYFVLNVQVDAFREGLIASLDELGLSYEESVSGFELPDLGDTLQVSIQGWMGTAQFRMKSRANRNHLRRVAKIMKARFASTPGRQSLLYPIVMALIGLLLFIYMAYVALDL